MSEFFNPFSLRGKTILITGASSGIGKATAIACSKMGATIVITGRNEDRLRQTYNELEGEGHTMLIADLNNADDLASLVNSTPQQLHGVVLCAGIFYLIPVKFCVPEKFKEILNTNLLSQAELVRLLLKKKKIPGGGSIVAIDSVAGSSIYATGNMMYGASKAALRSWAKYVGKELGPRNIRVNCICPGMVNTPLIQQHEIAQEDLAEDKKNYPLGRYGEPEEIAYGVVYLLSDASAWVTCSSLFIDGGISCF